MRVLGCIKITEMVVENYNFMILSKKYEPKTGHHLVSLAITELKDQYKEIIVKTECDYHWKKFDIDRPPQSHLVRLRTNQNY